LGGFQYLLLNFEKINKKDENNETIEKCVYHFTQPKIFKYLCCPSNRKGILKPRCQTSSPFTLKNQGAIHNNMKVDISGKNLKELENTENYMNEKLLIKSFENTFTCIVLQKESWKRIKRVT